MNTKPSKPSRGQPDKPIKSVAKLVSPVSHPFKVGRSPEARIRRRKRRISNTRERRQNVRLSLTLAKSIIKKKRINISNSNLNHHIDNSSGALCHESFAMRDNTA